MQYRQLGQSFNSSFFPFGNNDYIIFPRSHSLLACYYLGFSIDNT